VFFDLNEYSGASVTAEIAVVGTGACGMVMARRLLGEGIDVAFLETGGHERSAPAEALNHAELAGDLSVWIGSRSRFLGGSTNCWAGHASPFDPVDSTRDWVPEGRWPLDLSILESWAVDLHDQLRLGPVDFSAEFWANRLARVRNGLLFEGNDRITTKMIQRTNVGHMGELAAPDIERSPHLSVYLNAQVLELQVTRDGSQVIGLDLVSLDGSRRVAVRAKKYVLAAGPENARLLLASRSRDPRGVGNEYDQVGRYWLAHHSTRRGRLEPSPDLDWSLYELALDWQPGDRRVFGSLRISDAVQAEEKLLNAAIMLERYRPTRGFNNRNALISVVKGLAGRTTGALEPQRLSAGLLAGAAGDITKAIGRSATEVQRRRRSTPRAFVRNWCEQMPHPENRIELGNSVDRFGVPVLRVVSNLQPEDRRTMRRAFEIFAEEFEAAGYGTMIDEFPRGDAWPPGSVSTAHFMGGTRMSTSPSDGVVDTDCRVHGLENLYVAGGSVFPTAGASMVSYTAMLLTARLADHLSGAGGSSRTG